MDWFSTQVTAILAHVKECEYYVLPGQRNISAFDAHMMPQNELALAVTAARRSMEQLRVQNVSQQDVMSFLRRNFVSIQRIVLFLKHFAPSYEFSLPSMRVNKQNMFGLGKQIARRFMYDEYLNKLNISVIFKRFVLGITLFDDHCDGELGWPVYHRGQSCGPKVGAEEQSAYFDAKMRCSRTQDNNEVVERRKRVWNCYLERQIYDQLSKRYTEYGQDVGHVHEATNKVRYLFLDCFGHSAEMKVGVSFDENLNMPIALHVSYTTPELHRREHYRKHLAHLEYVTDPRTGRPCELPVYSDDNKAIASRWSSDILNRVETKSEKTQTCIVENPWTIILQGEEQASSPLVGGGGVRSSSRASKIWYTFVDGKKTRIPHTH